MGRNLLRRASARVANRRRAGGDRHPSPDPRRRHTLGRRSLPRSGEARAVEWVSMSALFAEVRGELLDGIGVHGSAVGGPMFPVSRSGHL